MLKATAGKTGAAYTAALRDVSAATEKQCQTSGEPRCEVVNLYRYFALEESDKGIIDSAVSIVRGADERALPNGKRLVEYRESALPDIEHRLASPAPVYASREKLAIAFWLGKLRELLDPDDPTVRALLGKESPEQVAERLVDGTTLAGHRRICVRQRGFEDCDSG